MKLKYWVLFVSVCCICLIANTQTLPLTDNMVIASNTSLKIQPSVYNIQDTGQDGLIRLNGVSNVIIDGDSVEVDGISCSGYAIKIDNSDHILIKNFWSVRHMNYAVYVTNSHHVEIEACNFSYNKVDSVGFIDVWAGYTASLGGGVMCYQCDSVYVHGNLMKYQNDGVALYQCRETEIAFNDFSWNTSYGIRMFYTDSSYLHHNICSHVNRPLTDPSDCAALLMIVSNENRVTYNDLSFSGDGVFLGQYQHHNTPNNNYFAYNDCSASPHNAIEATFAGGNVYKYNICSRSQYGLWLGYSFNTLVDSNLVQDNQVTGIAIDKGFNNTITHNWIDRNPYGIALWEGGNISGYSSQKSHDYRIDSNFFESNKLALLLNNTEKSVVRHNDFIHDYESIRLKNVSTEDTIEDNLFRVSLTYDINNQSSDDILAKNNRFYISDTGYIAAKVFDHHDQAGSGTVNWDPFTGVVAPVYVHQPPAELSEDPGVWIPYTDTCWWLGNPVEVNISWDTVQKKMGNASVHLKTGTGWFNTCSYRDTGCLIPRWDLSDYGYLSLWIRSVNNNLGAFQYFKVRIGNISGGWFEYNSSGNVLNQSLGIWKNYVVPLFGSSAWPRTQNGNISLSDINYVEVYSDSYGVGYELWLDGVQFLLANQVENNVQESIQVNLFPNPAREKSTLYVNIREKDTLIIDLFDVEGKRVAAPKEVLLTPGSHEIPFNFISLKPGMYWMKIQAHQFSTTIKTAVLK